MNTNIYSREYIDKLRRDQRQHDLARQIRIGAIMSLKGSLGDDKIYEVTRRLDGAKMITMIDILDGTLIAARYNLVRKANSYDYIRALSVGLKRHLIENFKESV